jgi:hypothetical protein
MKGKNRRGKGRISEHMSHSKHAGIMYLQSANPPLAAVNSGIATTGLLENDYT